MRQLPGLGVTYEDLYRRNKIADAVYEALVQQYEMSKIQEAKDTPKVQMLDVPECPEIKSYPPRSLIVLGCFLLSMCFAAGWVIACDQWSSVAETNSGKALLNEIASTFQQHAFWQSTVVLRVREISTKTVGRFVRQNTASPTQMTKAEASEAD
jgi:hypothetical protein